MKIDLTGKRALIAGGSRGIGLAIALRAAKDGASIAIAAKTTDPHPKLPGTIFTAAKEIEDAGGKSLAIQCDIRDENQISESMEKAAAEFGGIDILINNAGTLINKPFSETTLSDFDKVYKTNVFGVAELTRVVIPYMKKEGHVVNISSMGGVQGSVKFAGLAAYSSSKGALITLTELLAEEYKATGPSFNVLALGAVVKIGRASCRERVSSPV